MLLSSALATPIAGALALAVGVAIAFGRKYGDSRASLHEKTKTDELNELRLAIRDEHTIPIIGRLWAFLDRTNKELKSINLELDIDSLKFDVVRREKFNGFINEVFQSFKTEDEVKRCWSELVSCYSDLSRTLYLLGIVMALGGYSILILSLTSYLDNLPLETLIAVIVTISISAALGIMGYYVLRKIGRSLKLYQNAVNKYVVEVPRVT